MKNASGGCRNLKLRARKRFSPFPPAAGPPPPTPPFQKLRNAIEPLSGGIRGQTFCSTLQLSRSLKMLSWFYSGGFSGTIFVWEKYCLNRTGTSPALHQQGGNVRVAASYSDTFILHSENVPTSVALVARPCAPAAQRADESSNSRSRLAKSWAASRPWI